MKKVLLSFISFFCITTTWAQSVVVNSPAHLAGSYQFGTATAWGADLLSNIWTADAVLMLDDGTSMTDGCDNITNGADLAGKTVLVDRGSCNFSLKAKNAQDNGAISCIIFNNAPGAGVVPMGAGTFGPDVTIPVVMLSYEDGQAIKAELANGPVNISIGNIRFDNDLATNSRAAICHPKYGTYPAAWIKKAGEFTIQPSVNVTNKGNSVVTNVVANTIIEFTPTGGSSSEFYNKNSDGNLVIEIDSTRSANLESLDFFGKLPGGQSGKGTITYSIGIDNVKDESPFDNKGVSEFYLSSNSISKGRLQANGRDPMVTNSYRSVNTLNVQFLAGFDFPYGMGCKVDSIIGYMAVNSPSTLAGLAPEGYLYRWVDSDGDGVILNSELEFLALGSFQFDLNDTRTGGYFRIPLEDFNSGDIGYTIPQNDMQILVGVVYNGPETHFIGFDEGFDYTVNNQQLLDAGKFRDLDNPYIGTSSSDPNTGLPDIENNGFLFTGLRAGLAVSLIMSGNCIVRNENLPPINKSCEFYPNPADEYAFIKISDLQTTSKLKLDILDQFGRVLLSQSKINPDIEITERINLKEFKSGFYTIRLISNNHIQYIPFEVLKSR